MKKTKGWFHVNFYFGPSEGFCDYPKESGNYAIYITKIGLNGRECLDELLYIGTACNLKNRLVTHEIRKALYGLLDFTEYTGICIKCCLVKNTKERKIREKNLIYRLKPRINIA